MYIDERVTVLKKKISSLTLLFRRHLSLIEITCSGFYCLLGHCGFFGVMYKTSTVYMHIVVMAVCLSVSVIVLRMSRVSFSFLARGGQMNSLVKYSI